MTDIEMLIDFVALHGSEGATEKDIRKYIKKLNLKPINNWPGLWKHNCSGLTTIKGKYFAVRGGEVLHV